MSTPAKGERATAVLGVARRMSTYWRPTLALGAGAVLPFAFSPYDWYLLAPVCLALWMFLVTGTGPRAALARGWLFGVGLFGMGVPWVYTSIHEFGHAWAPAAAAITAGFASVLACFPALAAWLAQRWAVGRVGQAVAVLPAAWVLLEWVRSWFLTGFPWLSVGYSQIDGVLAGFAPYLGVLGVSWAVALSAGLLILLVRGPGRARAAALMGLLFLWLAAWGLDRVVWTHDIGEPVKIAAPQGNYSQDIKWHPDHRSRQLRWYAQATREHWDAAAVVWPETAVPAYYRQVAGDYLDALDRAARETDTSLLVGLPYAEREGRDYFNALIGLGTAEGVYKKIHLVPLGEYFPFKGLLRLVPGLDIPMNDMSAGEWGQAPLKVAGYAAGTTICYEDAFGALARRGMPGLAFHVNVSNDAWFGDTAPHQHLQIARMRAKETGRAMVRATNTGVSALIDHEGRLIEVAPQFKRTVLTGQIQPRTGATPYARRGTWPVPTAVAIVLGLAWWRRRAPLDA